MDMMDTPEEDGRMVEFDMERHELVGDSGSLIVWPGDEVACKLAMLIEGECEGVGPSDAAEKYGFSRGRYYQVLNGFLKLGSEALRSKKRGPKTNYRRTDEVVRQIIRHRFLDPDASPAVIAQKLRQAGFQIHTRSVERVIEQYGLQKKTT
jgi:transposase